MIKRERPLLLGSASPRRRDFISQLRLPFETCSPEVDESVWPGEAPMDYVARMAHLKQEASRVHARSAQRPFAGILSADTVVILGSKILTKPESDAAAVRMLSELVGVTHQVATAYTLSCQATGAVLTRCVNSEVRFRPATEREITRYVATGEGRDKAGGYALQGTGAFLVEAISGSYTNVIGLPVCELVQDLLQLKLIPSYP